MSEAAAKPPRMTVDEFVAWSEDQPGRYELFFGEVVKMQAEREAHTAVKLSVVLALRDALRKAGSGCRAYTDGRSVRIDKNVSFEPDALVDCGPRDPESIFAEQPVIVVEVISPSTSRIDSGLKFAGYFRHPSVRHYLVVDASQRFVIHHRRDGESIGSAILHARRNGILHLDPPGIAVEVGEFFADLPPDEAEPG